MFVMFILFAVLFLILSGYIFFFYKGKRTTLKFTRPSDYDVIIVGAGVCGITLSHTMAELGKKVLIIEKDLSNAERFVGEVLQPYGVKMLGLLGLSECLEGIDAQYLSGYGVYMKDFKQALKYPETDIGRGFHHAKFVKSLRDRITQHKNITLVSGSVNKILEENDIVVGASYTFKGEEKCSYAPLTCICAGVSSIFRSELNESEPVVASNFIALILKDVNDKILFPAHGNVLLEERPILMYPISSNEVRVLIDHKGDVPSATNGDLQKFLLEDVIRLIPEALHDAYKLAVATSLKYMPNRTLNADPKQKLGVFLLGDSLNCRHPLTGGGQSVIFSDIVILRELLQNIDFKDYGQLQDALEVFHTKRKSVAATINILANALYYIFSATEGNMEDMKKAVLQYFHLGGICVSGPMGFLSGLDPRPYYLLTHFFAVAIYGSLQIVWNSPLSILLAGSLVYKAAKLVVPIIRNEKILV